MTRDVENPAVTNFTSRALRPGLRLFILRPRTGKTHQLRVAMKSIGAPILGDTRYGGGAAERGYLHAAALRFEYSGRVFQFAELPQSGVEFCEPAIRVVLQQALQQELDD